MSSKTLCLLVRTAVIAVAICLLVLCCWIIPRICLQLAAGEYGYISNFGIPWLVFLSLAAVPCFVILVLIWNVSTSIKQEQVFTQKTAKQIRTGALVLLCDLVYYFIGNIFFLLSSASHPSVIIAFLFIEIVGFGLSVAAGVLSRYIAKAAELQAEVDGTI